MYILKNIPANARVEWKESSNLIITERIVPILMMPTSSIIVKPDIPPIHEAIPTEHAVKVTKNLSGRGYPVFDESEYEYYDGGEYETGFEWIRATVTLQGCPDSEAFRVSRWISLGERPDRDLISTEKANTVQLRGTPASQFCGFTDEILYDRKELRKTNADEHGILRGEWKITPEVDNARMGIPVTNHIEGAISARRIIDCQNNFSARSEVRLLSQSGCWSEFVPIVYICGDRCLDVIIKYSPNPTANELVIDFVENISDNENIPAEMEQEEVTYSVKLLDNMGVVQRQTGHRHRRKNKHSEVKFNTSSLREGTYFLHVEGNGELIREQIIIIP
jgi:hypothetical protein